MMKINKGFNLKILSLIISASFLFTGTLYPYPISNSKDSLRIPSSFQNPGSEYTRRIKQMLLMLSSRGNEQVINEAVEQDLLYIQEVIETDFSENNARLGYFDAESSAWEDIALDTATKIGERKDNFTFAELESIQDKYRGNIEINLFFWLVREYLERDYSAYAGTTKPLRIMLVLANNPRDTDKVNDALGIQILKGTLTRRFKDAVDITLIHPQIMQSDDEIISEIHRLNPDILGISQDFYAKDKVMRIASAVRTQKDKPLLILGNVGAASLVTEMLKDIPEALICTGEGEDMLSYVVSFVLGEDILLKDIPNLAYDVGGRVEATSLRPVEIKFTGRPSRDFIGHTRESLGMSLSEVSRGCKYNCSFCSRAGFLGRGNRARRIKDVLEEVVELSQAGIRFINFVDDDFSQIDLGKIWEFADGLIQLRQTGKLAADMRFSTSVTAVGVLKLDDYKKNGLSLLKKLSEAGFKTLYVGIESGAKEQLGKRYRKSANRDINIKALEAMRKEGIFCIAGFIMFDPKVSLQEVKQNIDFCRENGIDGSMVYAPKTLLVMLSTSLPTIYRDQIIGKPNYNTLSYEYFYDGPDADGIANILYILKQWEESHTAAYWESKTLKRSGAYEGLSQHDKEEILNTMVTLEILLMDYLEELVNAAIEHKGEDEVKEAEKRFSKKTIGIFLDILLKLKQEKIGIDIEKFTDILYRGIIREVIRVGLSEREFFSLKDIKEFLVNEFLEQGSSITEEKINAILSDYTREGMLKEVAERVYKIEKKFYYLRDLPYVDLPRPSKTQYRKICEILNRKDITEVDLRSIVILRQLARIDLWSQNKGGDHRRPIFESLSVLKRLFSGI